MVEEPPRVLVDSPKQGEAKVTVNGEVEVAFEVVQRVPQPNDHQEVWAPIPEHDSQPANLVVEYFQHVADVTWWSKPFARQEFLIVGLGFVGRGIESLTFQIIVVGVLS